MPTNVDGGWFLQLCPDGISVSAMGALFGDEHAHHHAEHAAHADDGETYSPCELGNGLTGDALTTLKLDPFRAFDSPNPYQPLNDWRPSGNAWRAFRPRAPPHSGLLQHLL